MVSNWEPAHSLVEDACLWNQDWSSPLSSGSGCHTIASLPLVGGRGLVCSQLALLWYSLNALFCEQARLCVRAFHWKVIFFLFLSLAIPLFGLLSHVSSLRLSSGHSRLVLTLSTDYTVHSSLSSPRSLVVDASVQATSLLAVVVRRIFCGILFFFFSSQLCCPLRFRNSPQIHL